LGGMTSFDAAQSIFANFAACCAALGIHAKSATRMIMPANFMAEISLSEADCAISARACVQTAPPL
jgi:hypothetical protein